MTGIGYEISAHFLELLLCTQVTQQNRYDRQSGYAARSDRGDENFIQPATVGAPLIMHLIRNPVFRRQFNCLEYPGRTYKLRQVMANHILTRQCPGRFVVGNDGGSCIQQNKRIRYGAHHGLDNRQSFGLQPNASGLSICGPGPGIVAG